MTKQKTPPAPPESRSPKGTGEDKRASVGERSGRGGPPPADDRRGQGAAVRENTSHKGYQQDR
jgi:hypothetical protein